MPFSSSARTNLQPPIPHSFRFRVLSRPSLGFVIFLLQPTSRPALSLGPIASASAHNHGGAPLNLIRRSRSPTLRSSCFLSLQSYVREVAEANKASALDTIVVRAPHSHFARPSAHFFCNVASNSNLGSCKPHDLFGTSPSHLGTLVSCKPDTICDPAEVFLPFRGCVSFLPLLVLLVTLSLMGMFRLFRRS